VATIESLPSQLGIIYPLCICVRAKLRPSRQTPPRSGPHIFLYIYGPSDAKELHWHQHTFTMPTLLIRCRRKRQTSPRCRHLANWTKHNAVLDFAPLVSLCEIWTCGFWAMEADRQTDRQTYTLITIPRPSTGDEVINRKRQPEVQVNSNFDLWNTSVPGWEYDVNRWGGGLA